tara:strand:+ start:57 stop:242 length:186 start_codon:yes stop_codon:yes gene_type:complete
MYTSSRVKAKKKAWFGLNELIGQLLFDFMVIIKPKNNSYQSLKFGYSPVTQYALARIFIRY